MIRQFAVENMRRLLNIVEYPELVSSLMSGANRDFMKDLLYLKKVLGLSFRTIIDVGAAVGEYSYAALEVFPEASLFAFEPIPENMMQIREKLKKKRMVYSYEMALDNRNVKSVFHRNEFSFSSSLLPMTNIHKKLFPHTTNETDITVQCSRFDSLAMIDMKGPILVKIDVQGAELRVLEGFGDRLKNIDAVQAEVNFKPFYSGQVEPRELIDFLASRGFSIFLERSIQFDPSSKRPLFADLVFLREESA